MLWKPDKHEWHIPHIEIEMRKNNKMLQEIKTVVVGAQSVLCDVFST